MLEQHLQVLVLVVTLVYGLLVRGRRQHLNVFPCVVQVHFLSLGWFPVQIATLARIHWLELFLAHLARLARFPVKGLPLVRPVWQERGRLALPRLVHYVSLGNGL